MSHFTTVTTQIRNPHQLALALQEAFGWDVELHQDEPVALTGWRGDNRNELERADPNFAPLCHVVVRRDQISDVSNDIGFIRQADGTYSAIVSEFDDRHFDGLKLKREYARQGVLATARAKGWQVIERMDGDKLRFELAPKATKSTRLVTRR